MGEIIAIMDKQNNQAFSICGWASYYHDTYNNYLIIDEGTGAIRTLYVFNLDTRKAIYKTDYCSDLKLDKQNGKIIFQTKIEQLPAGATAQVKEEEKEMMKENPNAFGYAETRNFNLKTLKEEHSGKFELKYFE